MKKIDFAFVILTFKTCKDLKELIPSIKEKFKPYTYSILIVNSFYDNATEKEIKTFSEQNGCDFLTTSNKGYGHGNNVGIEFFNSNYEYDFLVVANPDTKIIKNDFDYAAVVGTRCVIAPCVRTLTGKRQNPYWVIKNAFSENLVYKYFKFGHKYRFIIGIGINKIIRVAFNLKKKRHKKAVYAAHGSYLVFTRGALSTIGLPYDENMFLFAEENLLAHTLEAFSVPTFYTSDIEILHKEDGSVDISNIDENGELRKSIIYYYEKLNGHKKKA